MAKRAKLTERTRRRIEMALVRLMAGKSYEAVSMADIAREADVAVRTVQRHFGSKDDILNAAHRYAVQAISEELPKLPPGKTAREDLDSLVAALFAIYNRHREEMWAAFTRSAESPELVKSIRMAGRARIATIEALLARWAESCAVDPTLAKRTIIGLTTFPTWRSFSGVGGFGSPEAETVIARLLNGLIFGSTSAP